MSTNMEFKELTQQKIRLKLLGVYARTIPNTHHKVQRRVGRRGTTKEHLSTVQSRPPPHHPHPFTPLQASMEVANWMAATK